MRYFCSYSYVCNNTPCFGNCTVDTTIDPYDDIVYFRDKVQDGIGLPHVVLLFYKKVKS